MAPSWDEGEEGGTLLRSGGVLGVAVLTEGWLASTGCGAPGASEQF